jgi:hypothetical protein
MPHGVRFSLLGVVVVSADVMALVDWYDPMARRLLEQRGDIGPMPRSLFGRYGLPWPYVAVAIVVAILALAAFIHG